MSHGEHLWPPRTPIDVDLTDLERNLRETAEQARDAVVGFVENTGEDIQFILDQIRSCISSVPDIEPVLNHVNRCLAAADRMRERMCERAEEYHTTVMRVLTTAQIVPANILREAYEKIKGHPLIECDPNARLWRLRNPYEYVHQNAAPDPIEIPEGQLPQPQPGKKPLIFVHGKGCDGTPESALAGLFHDFEYYGHLFTDPRGLDGRGCEIYFISYDSHILDEAENIIRDAISSVLGGGEVTGVPELSFAAVTWRELERRAEVSAQRLLDRLTGFPSSPASLRPSLYSTSLGSLLIAHLVKLHIARAGEHNDVFWQWWAFAPAIPANAFTRTGDFERVPLAFTGEDRGEATRVFFSRFDLVLAVAYTAATLHNAMGVTGPLAYPRTGVDELRTVFEEDTTLVTGETHPATPLGDYFDRLGPRLRELLGKPDAPPSRR